MLLKPFDYIIALPLLGVVIASFFFAYTGAGGRGLVKLKGESGEWVFPLDTVETIGITGPLGDTVIAMRESGAHIVSSPCVNQSCVATGAIHAPGQWIACLPNRVMVYIEETAPPLGGNDIDAAAW